MACSAARRGRAADPVSSCSLLLFHLGVEGVTDTVAEKVKDSMVIAMAMDGNTHRYQ
jgi:hypothetical protein